MYNREVTDVKWKKISPNQWEGTSKNGEFDFVIESTDGDLALHIFDSKTENPSKAYIDSVEVDSVQEAKNEAKRWRWFHIGKHGGVYYINKKGNKVYV